MASLLKEPLLEMSAESPSPSKVFYYLTITKAQVIWRWWRISPRAVDRSEGPGELRKSHKEMVEDRSLQSEISIIFGPDVLENALSLCQGRINYLEKLPNPLLLHILGFLELEDVGQLLRTSRCFWKLCQSEEFWESAVRQRCSTITDEAVTLARHIGWRRVFFTNKIHLQLLINRCSLKTAPEVSVNPATDQGSDKTLQTDIGACGDEKPLVTNTERLEFLSEEKSSSPDPTSDFSFSPRSPSDPISSSEDEPQAAKGKESSERLKKNRQSQSPTKTLRQHPKNPLLVEIISSSEDENLPQVMREFPEKLRKYRLALSKDQVEEEAPGSSSSSEEARSEENEELEEAVIKSLTL